MKSHKLVLLALMTVLMSCSAYYNTAYNDDVYSSRKNIAVILQKIDKPVNQNNLSSASSQVNVPYDSTIKIYDQDYYDYRMGTIERTYSNQGYADDYFLNSNWWNMEMGIGAPVQWGLYPFYSAFSAAWGWNLYTPYFYNAMPWRFGYYPVSFMQNPRYYNPYYYENSNYYGSVTSRQNGSRNNSISSTIVRSANVRIINPQKSAVVGVNNSTLTSSIAGRTQNSRNIPHQRTINSTTKVSVNTPTGNVNRQVSNANGNVTRPHQTNVTHNQNYNNNSQVYRTNQPRLTNNQPNQQNNGNGNSQNIQNNRPTNERNQNTTPVRNEPVRTNTNDNSNSSGSRESNSRK